MTDLDPDTRYAIGLDIGDGESCLLWLDTANPAAEARIYERSQPRERAVLTALARRQETGEWVFGEAALLIGDVHQFVVNLKQVPAASLSTPDVVLFAQEFLDEFFRAHPEVRTSCQILVGYPTGWPADARDVYGRFLRTADVPLAMLPESQSALVHVWDLRRRHADGNGQQRDIDNVLVVDIGSSTVDVTMVTDLNPRNIEVGAELGCRDIDKELARMVTTALAGDPAFSQAMAHADAPMLLRLACRRAKEAQFSGHPLHLHDLPEALNPRLGAIVEHTARWLRAQDVPHLVEQHWAGRFRDLMLEVRTELQQPPEVVVLTGGGSRMPITRRICAEVFPEATPEMDDAPSFSVGRGLASAGRHRIQALRFRRDATGVAAAPEVRQALGEATVAAFTSVRDRTLETLRSTDMEKWEAVIESPPGLEAAVRNLEEAVDRTVRPMVNEVCDAYEIPGGQRDLDTKLAPPRLFTVDFVNRVMSMPGRPDLEFDGFDQGGIMVARLIAQSAAKGANNAVLSGAVGLAGRLRGGMRAGGKAALVIGAGYGALVGGIWAAKTIDRQRKRRQVLAELEAMELPEQAITLLEQELALEVARVVEQRIAPLERMLR